jgi:hypothetical protein
MGHVLMENCSGLVVEHRLSISSGTAEPEAAVVMVKEILGDYRITVGMDKGHDGTSCLKELRQLNTTPRVVQRNVHSTVDARAVCSECNVISTRVRKRMEEIYGWMKTVGVDRRTRFRRVERVGWGFTLAMATYNMVRIRNLMAQPSV